MRLVGDVVVMEGGHVHGQTDFGRRVMGVHHAVSATAESSAVPVPRAQAAGRSPGPDRDSRCVEGRYSLRGSTPGDGLWLGHDVLAAAPGLARGGCVGGCASGFAGPVARGRTDRLVAGGGGVAAATLGTGGFGGGASRPEPDGSPGDEIVLEFNLGQDRTYDLGVMTF